MATNICSRKRTKYISVKQFAEEYSVSVQQVYKLINQGLPTIRLGNACIRIPYEEAMNFISQRFNEGRKINETKEEPIKEIT